MTLKNDDLPQDKAAIEDDEDLVLLEEEGVTELKDQPKVRESKNPNR